MERRLAARGGSRRARAPAREARRARRRRGPREIVGNSNTDAARRGRRRAPPARPARNHRQFQGAARPIADLHKNEGGQRAFPGGSMTPLTPPQ